MKIFIYRQFLGSNFLNYYEDLYKKGSFLHHYGWFKDLLALFTMYETNDPDQADYFFIPILIIPFQFHHKPIDEFIHQCQFLTRGKHILFASGDYGQRAQSVYESHHPGRAYPQIYPWLDDKFILIALESTADLGPSDIAIPPYQLSFNRMNLPVNRKLAPGAHNNLLYSFCGVLSYQQLSSSHVRGTNGLIRISGHGDDWFIGDPDRAYALFGRELGQSSSIFSRSIFTLCPAGFGRWTFRWIEALLHGSIPIILSDGYILPFQNYIDWKKCVIILPENSIDAIDEFLREIPIGKVMAMQQAIEKYHYHFTREGCLSILATKLEHMSKVS